MLIVEQEEDNLLDNKENCSLYMSGLIRNRGSKIEEKELFTLISYNRNECTL
jgi:hypothetical protein